MPLPSPPSLAALYLARRLPAGAMPCALVLSAMLPAATLATTVRLVGDSGRFDTRFLDLGIHPIHAVFARDADFLAFEVGRERGFPFGHRQVKAGRILCTFLGWLH